jgi:NAD(P)-dependent dehydrogenase (short-subunit alcohol dehydrogenase family)
LRLVRELAGRVAVVTGAASGVGHALARRFIEERMKVVLADLDEGRLAEVAAELAAHGETVAIGCDVSKPEQVDELAGRAVDRFGAVHVLCNNAGVFGRADPWSGPLADWDWVLGVNLGGVVHGVRSFLPILRRAGEGHIVNTASMAGLTAFPGGVAYSVSKHGVVALSEALYVELQMVDSPIGVSCLCPGFVRTDLIDSAVADASTSDPGDDVRSMIGDLMRSGIETGMEPAQVAGEVVDAIRAGRFWVLTHSAQRQAPVIRMRRAARQENPPLGPESRHPELARLYRKLRNRVTS